MKKRQTLILVILCLLSAVDAQAQDIIINNDNDTIYCKILDVDNKSIRYQIQDVNRKITNTLNRKYIAFYQINDEGSEPVPEMVVSKDKKKPAIRFVAGGGYAGLAGKIEKVGDPELDQLSRDLINGYNLGVAIERNQINFLSCNKQSSVALI